MRTEGARGAKRRLCSSKAKVKLCIAWQIKLLWEGNERDYTILNVTEPLPKKKSAKTQLRDYFGKSCNILYETKAEADGYKSKVFCPKLGYAVGEIRSTEERAEQSAARKALEQLNT